MSTSAFPFSASELELLSSTAQAMGAGKVSKGATCDSILFESMPSDDYHADRAALSCSMLKPLLTSPAHYKLSLTQFNAPSDAMEFGSLLHIMVLEPQLLASDVAVYPGAADGRDKDFKAFAAKNCDRMVVDEPTFAKCRRLASKVRDNTYKGRSIGAFIDEAMCEVSIYLTEPTTGLRLRTRPDIYHPDITFDLKSTRQENMNGFSKDAVAMHYDLQAFMYTFARAMFEGSSTLKPFVFVAAETNSPHSVFVSTAGSSFIENGAKKFQRCLAIYKACRDTNYWPDLSAENTLEIEPWQQFSV